MKINLKLCFGLLMSSLNLVAVQTAQAGQVEDVLRSVPSTGYHRSGTWAYLGTNGFRIRVAGSKVTLTDVENKLTFSIDTANSAPQALPQQYLQLLQSRPTTSSAANLVKGISISNVRPGSKRGRILATITVNLELSSAFGTVEAEVQSDSEVTIGSQEMYQYVGTDYNHGRATVVDVQSGLNMKLTRFNSTVVGQSETASSFFNNLVGLVLDVALRVGSLGLQTTDRLYSNVAKVK